MFFSFIISKVFVLDNLKEVRIAFKKCGTLQEWRSLSHKLVGIFAGFALCFKTVV